MSISLAQMLWFVGGALGTALVIFAIELVHLSHLARLTAGVGPVVIHQPARPAHRRQRIIKRRIRHRRPGCTGRPRRPQGDRL